MSNGYSTTQVAELLGLTVAEVRRCVRAGFLTAHADGRLSFQDLVSLRRASELMSSRLRPHRVRSALRRLRDQLPEGQHLASVHVSLEGQSILAREGANLWNPLSGQLHLDFQAPTPRSAPARHARPPNPAVAEAHYTEGCELEERSAPGAEGAYRRALELSPEHRDARINLGRLLHEAGHAEEATLEYLQVLEAGPSALASFNLAVALEDLGRSDDALGAYHSAIAADPDCEDAYFNLARIYERQGQRAQALRALRTYRNLTR